MKWLALIITGEFSDSIPTAINQNYTLLSHINKCERQPRRHFSSMFGD